MYRYICKRCGARLDPSEKCDCEEKEKDIFHTSMDGKLVDEHGRHRILEINLPGAVKMTV